MKRFVAILTVLALQSILVVPVLNAHGKHACCTKVAPCEAQVSCCLPDGQKATSLPAGQTTASTYQEAPTVALEWAVSATLPYSARISFKGASGGTHPPPLFILNASFLI